MTVKPSGLLLVHHVAEILNCTDRHVRNLIKDGRLEAVKIGKREYRIKREAVIIFLENNQVEANIFLN